MEELILKISQNTLNELKKANKLPYPLYYKNIFNTLAKDEGVYEDLNPKLLCEDEGINEEFLSTTEQKLNILSSTSKELKEDSENLMEKVTPLQIDEIKETLVSFTAKLIEKINRLEDTIHSLEVELDKAYKDLLIDPLTKVYNRKALTKDLSEILKAGVNRDLDLVVAIVDLDMFKEINDRYGHLVGDYVLIKVAEIIRKMIRKENRIYRYGGDEFVIVFNRLELDKVVPIVSRIVEKIDATSLKYKDHIIKLTISMGLTQHKKGDTFEDILKRADSALYEAKLTRNKYSIKA